jgi:leucine-rich repeat protein SHOC2
MTSDRVLNLIATATRDRATKLDLSGQFLTELPESVCEIDSLLKLDLSNNQLSLLPDSIGNLHRLTQIYLQSNDLAELPESIGKLTKLKVLVIHKNPLTKLPESIGNLTRLTILRPYRSGRRNSTINSLPESIGDLVNLKRLHVNSCQLITLPKSIGNLKRLNQLSLAHNQLTNLPESIGELIELKELDISGNEIAKLPQSIGKLTDLFKLKIGKNPLTDLSILQALPKLKHVICFPGGDLHRRYWINLSEWKSEWILDEKNYHIRYLIVKQLGIDRVLSDLANIRVLFKLNLDRSLPTEHFEGIGDLKNLTELIISGNNLTAIPDEIQNATNLKSLDISRNKISLLPESICNLTELQELYLHANQISELPEKFGNLVKLKYLHLYYNRLQKIPDSIDQFQDIEFLFLGGNHLTELPDSIGKCQQIKKIDLGNNHLTKLPETFSRLVNLKYLNLHLNPIEDLSPLQNLPVLERVWIFNIILPSRYWIKFSDWKAEWLLDENNAEIRRRLIEQVGYEKICGELGAIAIDSWHEYTLLKIDNIQIIYQGWREVGREPMMLLKMTCPSTAHIHILRVPPDMTRAEDAIVWVNHGIHPSKFSIQT